MMADLEIEPGAAADYDAVLELNEAAVPHVNSISTETLGRLHAQSTCLTVVRAPGVAGLAGFLLALPQSAAYESLNFGYFRRHYPQFVYIDRVVISPQWRRGGIGQALYRDLFTRLPADCPLVCCEVNVRPPNAPSLAFHRRMGFSPVGEQDTEGGKKRVSLLVRYPDRSDDP